MTEEIDENGVRMVVFDRVKDDECHNCIYAIRKPEDKTRAPWTRLFGCTGISRIKCNLIAAKKRLESVIGDMDHNDWQPNMHTVHDIDNVSKWASDAADMLHSMYRDGYMEPEIICVYKVGKTETETEEPK